MATCSFQDDTITFTNETERYQAIIKPVQLGWGVSIQDLDAMQQLPTIKVFALKSEAVDYAVTCSKS
jgi:hypothetical protein